MRTREILCRGPRITHTQWKPPGFQNKTKLWSFLSRSTLVVKTGALCCANPGKWHPNLTVSYNFICNFRRCLETFQLSAQSFPTAASRTVNAGLFFFLLAPQTHWLEVNGRLTVLRPNCCPAVQEWLGGGRNYGESAAVVTHFQLPNRKMGWENVCWL